MNRLLILLTIVLVVSVVLPVYGQTVVLNVRDTTQGTNSQNAVFDSASWLQWKLVYQDNTEAGTTQSVRSTFEIFPAFDPTPLFSFVPQDQNYRTLIVAEIIGVTDFKKIGLDFCFDQPRWTFKHDVIVNGKSTGVLRQLFGTSTFDIGQQQHKGFGIKFTPQFIQSQLASEGIILKSGDVITWKVTADNRYTIWKGEIDPVTDLCGVTSEIAFDAYAVGMSFQQTFVWLDPFDQIIRPVTTEPDLDGDGIPDSVDQCDFSPERFNGFQDEDGCPDLDPVGFDATRITDQDGDGILDQDDKCPTEPEIFNGIEDGDGCPDGATLPTDFPSFDATGEPLESFTQASTDPLALPTADEVIGTVPIDEIILIEGNPATMFQTQVSISGTPILTTGSSEFCDTTANNCDEIFFQAVKNFEQQTGIDLPFEPTVLNLVFLLGIVVAVIIITMFLLRRFKIGKR